jgi:hypothetical protein
VSDYRVLLKRSPRRIRQRYHVTIVDAGNGRTLFTSENLTNRAYALKLAERMAEALRGALIDLT